MTESNPPPPQQPYDPGMPPPAPPVGAQPPVGYAGPATGAGYPGPYVGPEPDKDSKTMAMLAHLLSIFTGFIGPLVIWLIKKDQSRFVDDQGKESLNFQLTLLIGYIIAGATSCLFIGLVLFPVLWVLGLVFAIMATMKANQGVAYRYPFNIRFIK
jgi:uncharacterized Tic20 family protein